MSLDCCFSYHWDSYLRGYEYWADESSDERRRIFKELKAAGNRTNIKKAVDK